MPLTRADVEKVASLARLELSPVEIDALTPQLQHIVEYVESLSVLDTRDVAPMAHALDVANVFADDVPRESLPREQALSNAPKHDGTCYLVPAVLGE
jgi:aspartyl-tRNA(Asn)/glutamyl-tRNA(Gln) amidotransferase subunit C